jgi:predicted lipoprotein with Yx(FWY)xxD motif
MRHFARAYLVAGFVLAGLTASLAQSAPAAVGDTAKGKALVNGDGMTLYTFDNDSKGKSNCNGQCANLWLPLIATTDASASGDFSLITRSDGRKQWAYKGKPLYSWTKDTKPGDTSGDGVNSVWHIAVP